MIDIFFSFHTGKSDYYKHTGVAMVSILEHTAGRVCFHIMHDREMPESARNELSSVAAQYGQSAVFYDVPDIPPQVLDAVKSIHGRGTMYNLYMHRVLPLEKVLYMDCDIICQLDVEPLYNLDVSGCLCAAVPEQGIQGHIRKSGFAAGKYVNNGVMLVNLAWMREHGEELESLIVREMCGDNPPKFSDQDILNMLARDHGYNILYLEEKYNYMIAVRNRQAKHPAGFEDKIIHFTKPKPWYKLTIPGLSYWRYYNKSPWRADTFERMSELEWDELGYVGAVLKLKERAARNVIWRYSLGWFGQWKKRLECYRQRQMKKKI